VQKYRIFRILWRVRTDKREGGSIFHDFVRNLSTAPKGATRDGAKGAETPPLAKLELKR